MVNLQLDGITIRQIDAKLSLGRNAEGNVMVNLHPINKEIKTHPLLTEQETQDLFPGNYSRYRKNMQTRIKY
jgi:hypothetical protein